MVVFEDGLPRKDQYRSFGVPETTDDTDSLYQVLTRRLAYLDRPESQGGDEPDGTPDAVPGGSRVLAVDPDAAIVTDPDAAGGTTRQRPRFAYPPPLLVLAGGQPQAAAAAPALAAAGQRETPA